MYATRDAAGAMAIRRIELAPEVQSVAEALADAPDVIDDFAAHIAPDLVVAVPAGDPVADPVAVPAADPGADPVIERALTEIAVARGLRLATWSRTTAAWVTVARGSAPPNETIANEPRPPWTWFG